MQFLLVAVRVCLLSAYTWGVTRVAQQLNPSTGSVFFLGVVVGAYVFLGEIGKRYR